MIVICKNAGNGLIKGKSYLATKASEKIDDYKVMVDGEYKYFWGDFFYSEEETRNIILDNILK